MIISTHRTFVIQPSVSQQCCNHLLSTLSSAIANSGYRLVVTNLSLALLSSLKVHSEFRHSVIVHLFAPKPISTNVSLSSNCESICYRAMLESSCRYTLNGDS